MAIEKEVKYLINKLPDNVVSFSYFEQFYFECVNLEDELKKLFKINSLDGFNTKRVRMIKNENFEKYIITLKTSGLYEREELEEEISKELFIKILSEPILSSVKKNRYIVEYNNYNFEFDEYLNLKTKLFTCEVEDEFLEDNQKEIEEILKNYFKVSFVDVTLDSRYKNNNITKYF